MSPFFVFDETSEMYQFKFTLSEQLSIIDKVNSD